MRNIILILVFLFSATMFSQNTVIREGRKVNTAQKTTSKTPNRNVSQPWRVGGGVGMSFGSNDYIGISVTPFIGYKIIESLEAGVSTGYQYTKRTHRKQHLFNVGPYLNFYPIPEFFARVQYEYYRGSSKHRTTNQSYNFDENALWVGAGYRNSGPVQFYAGIMYNLLYHSNDSSVFTNGFRPIAGVSFRI